MGQGRSTLGETRGGVYLTESVLWAVEDRASQLYISKRIVVGRYYGFFFFFKKVLFVCV